VLDRRARDHGPAVASEICRRLAQFQDALILQGGDGAAHLVLRLRDALRWHAFQATPPRPGVTFDTVDCDAVGHRLR
jgi:hypothetical protein